MKRFAFNRLFTVFLLLCGLCLAGMISLLPEDSLGFSLFFGALALLFLVGMNFTPCCYLFDSEGVSLCYILMPKERYLWKNIHTITVEYEWGLLHTSDSALFDFLFTQHFSLDGDVEGTRRFYMSGCIRRSFRTKRLLETYWDGTITGYLLDDAKQWLAKRRRKKQKEIRAHLTDEVTPMEREVRAQVREWLSPFAARAKQHDLALRTEFLYVTEDGRQLHSRPKEGYTYECLVHIVPVAAPQRCVDVSATLLYIRLGRTAYRGVTNRAAREELTGYLEECLTEMIQNGPETYGV